MLFRDEFNIFQSKFEELQTKHFLEIDALQEEMYEFFQKKHFQKISEEKFLQLEKRYLTAEIEEDGKPYVAGSYWFALNLLKEVIGDEAHEIINLD